MNKKYLQFSDTRFLCFFLKTEDSEAVFRSELAKARTFSDVVSILEWINNKQRIAGIFNIFNYIKSK